MWLGFIQGQLFNLDICQELSKKYGKSVAQVILSWNLQKGIVTIPKFVKKERISANAIIFDFEITAEAVTYLDSLNRGERIGPDPNNFDFNLP